MKTIRKLIALSLLVIAFFTTSCEGEDEPKDNPLENTPSEVLSTLEQMFLENDLSIGDAIFADSVVYKNSGEIQKTTAWNNPGDMGYEFVHFFPRWFVLEPWRDYYVDEYELRNVDIDETSNTKTTVYLDEYIVAYVQGDTENPLMGTAEPIIIVMEPINNKWHITEMDFVEGDN